MSRVLPLVLERVRALGFRVFEGENYDLNLFGIRTKDPALTFNDYIGCAYKVGQSWRVHYWPATTDPGWYYLQNASERFGVKGTAILVGDKQYRGAYEIGNHRGYEALVQTGAEVSVHRDATRDHDLQTIPENIETGWYGINLHGASSNPYEGEVDRTYKNVGPWSGGCQVVATNEAFRSMMELAHKQVEHHPTWTTFTYTLLNQWW